MRVVPLYDRVLLRKEDAEEVTRGGIVIPQNAAVPSVTGVCLAVGTGRNYDGPGFSRARSEQGDVETTFERPKMIVRVGDRCVFGKFSGAQVDVDGETLFLCREDEILAIIE